LWCCKIWKPGKRDMIKINKKGKDKFHPKTGHEGPEGE
jgi:hypothetical protein